jgi:hypothetical protein
MTKPHASAQWTPVFAAVRPGTEDVSIPPIRRLASFCKRYNLGPSFNAADRDMIIKAAVVQLKDGRQMVASGLKQLHKLAARHPELQLTIVAPAPTPAQIAVTNKHASHGSEFNTAVEAFVTAINRPVDHTNRARKVPKKSAINHRKSLRRAKVICIQAKLRPALPSDLLDEEAIDAIIEHYGDSDEGSGGRDAILGTLLQYARHVGDDDAADRIEVLFGNLGKRSDALSLDRLSHLSIYNDAAKRDDLIRQLAGIASTIVDGWPNPKSLPRVQHAFAGLFAYYAIATPSFVVSIAFAGECIRPTPGGLRPLLVARDAPAEPLENRFPEKLIALIDLYWAQMPEKARDSREFFVNQFGDRVGQKALTEGLRRLLKPLTALTSLGLIDLAVLDMVWDDELSAAQMALTARFVSERNFNKRYKPLIENIKTLRGAKGGHRPDSSGVRS